MPFVMNPAVTHLAESALYVDDLPQSLAFYRRLFDVPILREDERFAALRINADQVLLLFRRGASLQPSILSGGIVPSHDGSGPLHVCFGISEDDLEAWETKLETLDIAVESRVRWPSGAVSLYFRDPDDHAVELATPGVWD
jgi:catechol 2,3-dioxygenase-like lactoylglutathione lyase family enzyme